MNPRNRVLWFGAPPTPHERRAFAERNLVLEHEHPTGEAALRDVCGFVMNAVPPYVDESAMATMKFLADAIRHGALAFLLAANDAAQGLLQDCTPVELRATERIISRTAPYEPSEYAERIARHDPGPAYSPTLSVTAAGPPVPSNVEFLVRRAFGDCTEVHLEPLDGGLSATTYQVHARLQQSQAGPRPMPFFAKVDTLAKIRSELRNYEVYAASHIPFNLRPNLDTARCTEGAEDGILVGNFVENSRPLWDVALDGMGERAIHGLFEETLMGWRRQAYQSEPTRGHVANALASVLRYREILPEHVRRASEFGPIVEPAELLMRLLNTPEQTFYVGPSHGDLHGRNVRVRRDDAIQSLLMHMTTAMMMWIILVAVGRDLVTVSRTVTHALSGYLIDTGNRLSRMRNRTRRKRERDT